MENIRKRVNVRFFNEGRKLKKAISKPTCEYFINISDDLAMLQFMRKKITQSNPLYTGFVVLELPKCCCVIFTTIAFNITIAPHKGEASMYKYRQPVLQNSDR